VQKARNAEYAGAKLLMIVDNKDENEEEMILSDDGTGTDI